MQAGSFRVQPSFELDAPGKVKALQQLSAVQSQGLLYFPRLEKFLEHDGVAPQAVRVEAQLLVPEAHEDSIAQPLAQDVGGLIQRPACPLVAYLRPEQAEEGVTAMETPRTGEGKIRQKRHPFGTGEDRIESVSVIGIAEIDGSQRAEFDQALGSCLRTGPTSGACI